MKPNALKRTSANVPTAEPAFDPFRFTARHIGPRPEDVTRMLAVVGAQSLDALIDQALPADIRQAQPLDLGPALSEPELLAKMRAVAARNRPMVSMIDWLLSTICPVIGA